MGNNRTCVTTKTENIKRWIVSRACGIVIRDNDLELEQVYDVESWWFTICWDSL